MPGILFLVIVAGLILFFTKAVRIVKQAEVIIIERFGKFDRILESGFNIINPIFEMPRTMQWKETRTTINGDTYSLITSSETIDLRERVFDFPRQNVITRDNASIGINAILYYQIIDPQRAIYEIYNLSEAIEKLAQTTLRNIFGELDLDESFVSRDTINDKLRIILDEATNKWGVKVNRVELQDIIPPKDIQMAMEKQMKAERDRRAAILEAEGLKKAAILKSEGLKESEINKAEGEKRAAVLNAEGDAEARIKIATAEAEAIKLVVEAIADKGDPDKYLIAVRYLDAFKEMVSGQNNKVVYLPYEASGILSSLDGIKQLMDSTK